MFSLSIEEQRIREAEEQRLREEEEQREREERAKLKAIEDARFAEELSRLDVIMERRHEELATWITKTQEELQVCYTKHVPSITHSGTHTLIHPLTHPHTHSSWGLVIAL